MSSRSSSGSDKGLQRYVVLMGRVTGVVSRPLAAGQKHTKKL